MSWTGPFNSSPTTRSLLARRATLRLAAGQPVAALDDVNRALAVDDQDGDLYFLQARAYRALGRLPQALAAARAAAANGFNSPELPLLEGETRLAARQYDAALASLDRTLRLDPDQSAALFYKGLAYAATQDTVQALDYLRAALARDLRQPEILHQLAFLLNAYRASRPRRPASLPRALARFPRPGRCTTISAASWNSRAGPTAPGATTAAPWPWIPPCTGPTTAWPWLPAGGQRPASVIPHLQRALAPQSAPTPGPRHLGRSSRSPAPPARSPAPVPATGARKPRQSSTGPIKRGKPANWCAPPCPIACARRAPTTPARPTRPAPGRSPLPRSCPAEECERRLALPACCASSKVTARTTRAFTALLIYRRRNLRLLCAHRGQ
ncbi:MAG: tetratricopeptide repeat protein [Hymenobacter sp.]